MKTHARSKFSHKISAIAGLIMVLSITACASASPSSSSVERGQAAPAPSEAVAPGGSDSAESGAPAAQPGQPGSSRMIIQNADMTIVVQDTQAQLDALNKIAADYGGYIASTSTYQVEKNALQAQVTLRVESAQLNAALERIRKLAVEVRSESLRGDDVTAEYVDLDAQLKNLEAAEAQLKTIMAQAEKTEDVMAVFQQLTTIRGQIEQIKGRMKYLSQSASLATINLTLIPDTVAQPVQIAGWRPEGVAKDALEALISALQGLATLAIWFVIVLLPILLIIAIPIVILIAVLRRVLRRNRKVAPVVSTTESTLPPAS